MEQRYKKLSEYASDNGIIYRTAWNRFNAGKIKGAFKDETGHVLIPLLPTKDHNTVILYARVSNNDRKTEVNYQLDRLKSFAYSRGYKVIGEIVEIASGMNDNRNKLNKVLIREDWDLLIIENKDRLTRFGFNYIKLLLNTKGKDVIVMNETDSDKTDLIQDLLSIIYSFSARLYGLRKKKNKDEIVKFLES